jgi:hypothetical protein
MKQDYEVKKGHGVKSRMTHYRKKKKQVASFWGYCG